MILQINKTPRIFEQPFDLKLILILDSPSGYINNIFSEIKNNLKFLYKLLKLKKNYNWKSLSITISNRDSKSIIKSIVC